MDGWTDGKIPSVFYRTLFPLGPLPKKGGKGDEEEQGKEAEKKQERGGVDKNMLEEIRLSKECGKKREITDNNHHVEAY